MSEVTLPHGKLVLETGDIVCVRHRQKRTQVFAVFLYQAYSKDFYFMPMWVSSFDRYSLFHAILRISKRDVRKFHFTRHNWCDSGEQIKNYQRIVKYSIMKYSEETISSYINRCVLEF